MSRVCPDCGEALEAGEQFCGNCGCYLDWTEMTDAPAAAEPEPAQVVGEPAPRGIAERVRSALGVGEKAPPPPPGPPPTGPPRTGPPPTGPPPTERPVPGSPPVLDVRGTAERPGTAEQPGAPAAGLVVPLGQPAAGHPGAQQPARARMQPKPRGALPPPEPLNPGDLVCGNCGAGNTPSRKFCRRCGDDLAAAEVAKVPWWKRVFRRRTKATVAGTRPRGKGSARRRVPVKLLVLLGVLGALGFGAFFVRGLVVDGVEAVRDRVEGVEQQQPEPDDVKASSSLPGHGARLATDGNPADYWAPVKPGKGVGEYLVITFDDPVRLVYVLITAGVSPSNQEKFLAQGRPADLKIVVDREDGTTEVKEVHLEDKRGAQQFGIGESDVTKVRLEILESYVGAPGSYTAVGEVEFFTRK